MGETRQSLDIFFSLTTDNIYIQVGELSWIIISDNKSCTSTE